MKETQARVLAIEPLTQQVSRVRLQPEQPFNYRPGQYLKVVMSEQDRRPFSIANAPSEDGVIELHIGAGADNQYAAEVLTEMQSASQVTIDGGHGNAALVTDGQHPTVLLAGGTGFSYTRAILQALLPINGHEPVYLYWGAQTFEDLYAFDELKALERDFKHFTFIPVVEKPPADWTGKTGWVHKAVLEDFVSLEPYHVYVAGRFEMAGVAREDFHAKGLLLDHLFGDAYDFI
ncbi:NAD(P)H-flavin reductase [Aestuariibacter halophilus]|uniref:NAD(P)H-flavin reductase n=1 Tax=Fluctibacter halophilus TaxID=226011 RepID=A0ABS8G9U3_9ALTE|nr:NAD(P)H-flavin reductase [Aestuariibacter halophilus]MCC2617263.1 NAD(P)H-flavin reductase [Aestuariibacter halophilus]